MLRLQLAGLSEESGGLHRLNNLLSLVVAFAGLLLVFYYSSVLFWRFSYPEEFKAPVSVPVKDRSAVVSRGSWRWFQDTAVATAPQRKVKSKLKAQLIGVIAQGGEGEGIALISVAGKQARIFRVGDEIVPVTFLKSVQSYSVQLERDGQIEVLEIKRTNLFKSEGGASDGEADDEADGEVMSKQQFRQTLKEKPLRIVEFANFKKTKDGFSVSPKSEEYQPLFDELGLLEGDVIISANGLKIEDLSRKPKAWRSIIGGEKIALQVLRDGIITDIFID